MERTPHYHFLFILPTLSYVMWICTKNENTWLIFVKLKTIILIKRTMFSPLVTVDDRRAKSGRGDGGGGGGKNTLLRLETDDSENCAPWTEGASSLCLLVSGWMKWHLDPSEDRKPDSQLSLRAVRLSEEPFNSGRWRYRQLQGNMATVAHGM